MESLGSARVVLCELGQAHGLSALNVLTFSGVDFACHVDHASGEAIRRTGRKPLENKEKRNLVRQTRFVTHAELEGSS